MAKIIARVCAGLALLLFATSASADCAWLLWHTYESTGKPFERGIVRAFESQQACEKVIPEDVQNLVSVWSLMYTRVTADPQMGGTQVIAKGTKASGQRAGDPTAAMIIRASCWPVGVQPSSMSGAEYPGTK